jgi:hypothetical protein
VNTKEDIPMDTVIDAQAATEGFWIGSRRRRTDEPDGASRDGGEFLGDPFWTGGSASSVLSVRQRAAPEVPDANHPRRRCV